MLISAYDLFHGHIPPPNALDCTPELTILDSGGYEAGFDEDLSAAVVRTHHPESWTPENLTAVLDAWPDRFPAVFVSYDHPERRTAVADQVAEAQALFARYPNQMHSLLIKPETKTQDYLKAALDSLTQAPNLLRDFHVIGVTEKELASSALDRMQRIAELRVALDSAGIAAPIQVFGALDPVSSCLYFLAGAEIFDGLTWLRYAYHQGLCVYRANYGAMTVGVNRRDILVEGKTMTDNLNAIRSLELSMKRVAHDHEIAHFEHHQDLLGRAFDDLRARLGGLIP